MMQDGDVASKGTREVWGHLRMVEHLSSAVDGHNWPCHPRKGQRLLGMDSLSCDSGDIVPNVNGSARGGTGA